MLEIEVKYRVADLEALEQRLVKLGARHVESRDDADAYFNAPYRDFARTDEALRVRHIANKNFVTYKGPRTDAETKTRLEVEVPLADGPQVDADFRRLLGLLGFRPVAVVKKRRRVYQLARDGFEVKACLDDVEQVGSFAELEIVADKTAFEPAKAVVLALATELDLNDVERRSYLEMLLEVLD